jgi:hypothetical protein
MSCSSILSALATSHLNPSALSVTHLSLAGGCDFDWPLDPAHLPFLRSLTVTPNYHPPLTIIYRILPQLTSLIILNVDPNTIAKYVTLSTSLKLLSLSICAIGDLNLDTQAIIRARIEQLRVVVYGTPSSDPYTALSAIVSGSRVIKKVIVDGSKSSSYGATMTRTMKTLVPVCKKAKVELWKENFKAGNGKVDVDSE